METRLGMLLLAMVLWLPQSFASEYSQDKEQVVSSDWPRIFFIEEGTEWDLEVTPADSNETLSVVQTIDGSEIVNNKEYFKLWSSVNDGERELISYLYIDGRERMLYALNPGNTDAGERLIYNFGNSALPVASINWKGELSDNDYYISFKAGSIRDFLTNGFHFNLYDYNVYSSPDHSDESYLGSVEWINGLGNPTGLLNQLYCLNNSDEVKLMRIVTECNGVVYDSQLASVDDLETDTEKTIVGIYNTNGQILDDCQPGLNIIRYSDGTVKKIMK